MKNKNKRKPEEELPKDTAAAADVVVETDEAGNDAAIETEEKANPLEEELAAEKEKYLRLAAEYDNFRKRSQRERENIYADVRADTVLRFLTVYDNLERALIQETDDEAYYKGIELIMTGFNDMLEKLGVSVIESVGERFDPELHNAVMHEEDDTKGESEIVEELQKGFKLGDKVIRFSLVKVAN